jgi:hypothetical protein
LSSTGVRVWGRWALGSMLREGSCNMLMLVDSLGGDLSNYNESLGSNSSSLVPSIIALPAEVSLKCLCFLSCRCLSYFGYSAFVLSQSLSLFAYL